MTEGVLSFEDALGEVLAHAAGLAAPREMEELGLSASAGRVLAKAVKASRDQPPFDRSTRDGFAVRAADVTPGAVLRLAGAVRAGEAWRGPPLAAGEAIEIMTGAPMPAGADAVLMVEHAALRPAGVVVAPGRALSQGQNVVARAAEAHSGATVLPRGTVVGAAEVAMAASCGCAALRVYARPRVAILATGDELVGLEQKPQPWQIYNSNSYALASLVDRAGAAPQTLAIARDEVADLRGRIAEGRAADLLLLSGGVSMGKFDLVEQVLAELGADFFFTGALIQPGKPIVFGRLPGSRQDRPWTYFFGLPGNPVSTQVCFHLFVAPLLRALAGQTSKIAPRFVEARLAMDVSGGCRVTRFLPAELVSAWDSVSVRLVGWQGSGDLAANARANCYVVLPAGVEAFRAGETVRVLLR